MRLPHATARFALIGLAGVLPGCMAMYAAQMETERLTQEKVRQPFLVLDAETNQPIPDATVTVAFHHGGMGGPWYTSAKADAHGQASVPVYLSKYGHSSSAWATAPDYLPGFFAPETTLRFSATRPTAATPPQLLRLYRTANTLAPAAPLVTDAQDPPSARTVAILGLTVPDGFQGTLEYSTRSFQSDRPDPRLQNPLPPDRIFWADYHPPVDPEASSPEESYNSAFLMPPSALGGASHLDARAYRYRSGTIIPIADPATADPQSPAIFAWPIGVHGDAWSRSYFITHIGTFASARTVAEKLRSLPDAGLSPGWSALVGPTQRQQLADAIRKDPSILSKLPYTKPRPAFATSQPSPK